MKKSHEEKMDSVQTEFGWIFNDCPIEFCTESEYYECLDCSESDHDKE